MNIHHFDRIFRTWKGYVEEGSYFIFDTETMTHFVRFLHFWYYLIAIYGTILLRLRYMGGVKNERNLMLRNTYVNAIHI